MRFRSWLLDPYIRDRHAFSELAKSYRAYDRKKYAVNGRRAVWSQVRPFELFGEYMGGSKLRESLLYIYF